MNTPIQIFQKMPEVENRWRPNDNVLIRTNEIVLLPFHENRIVEGPYYSTLGFIDPNRSQLKLQVFIRNPNTKEYEAFDNEIEIMKQMNAIIANSLRHCIHYSTRRTVDSFDTHFVSSSSTTTGISSLGF